MFFQPPTNDQGKVYDNLSVLALLIYVSRLIAQLARLRNK